MSVEEAKNELMAALKQEVFNITMNKNEIIQIAEMNIDDLRKRKIKRIFTCLGISTAIIAVVAAAKATGIDYNSLNVISTVAMAVNSGILGVTVNNVFKAYLAEKISREELEKYKNGEYPTEEEYYEFLKAAVEYAGYAMTDMEQRMDQSKGVSK